MASKRTRVTLVIIILVVTLICGLYICFIKGFLNTNRLTFTDSTYVGDKPTPFVQKETLDKMTLSLKKITYFEYARQNKKNVVQNYGNFQYFSVQLEFLLDTSEQFGVDVYFDGATHNMYNCHFYLWDTEYSMRLDFDRESITANQLFKDDKETGKRIFYNDFNMKLILQQKG